MAEIRALGLVTERVLRVLCSSSDSASLPEVQSVESGHRLVALKAEEVKKVKEVLLLKSSSSPSSSSMAITTTTHGLGGHAILSFVSFDLDLSFVTALRFSTYDLRFSTVLSLYFLYQLYCEKERLREDQFEQLKMLVDIGDILGACGSIKRTEKGELSICVNSFRILTKSLLPLPDKYHGLIDIDKRYRQRYVDMIANPEVPDVFRARAKAKLQRRRQELTQTTPDQLVDDEVVYYKVAGECLKGRFYSLWSLGRKRRRYVDPDASTSQLQGVVRGGAGDGAGPVIIFSFRSIEKLI
ncbi:hypothetical protein Syun_009437 [Stephania yunnanensis]|uniref:Uncharacterized protein n=1 Tax=Stephania yunnanensis TaxID=152371 RepID=A0AAP0KG55_9MAGN